jgi:hypothetical protein
MPAHPHVSTQPDRSRLLSRRAIVGLGLAGAALGSVLLGRSRSTVSLDGTVEPEGDRLRFSTAGWATDFTIHSVPLVEIMPGGPGKDGIAPIDAPAYVSAEEASEWLDPVEPVIRITLDGDAGSATRAYPIQILIWHEIVNDVLAGLPILVTFCPLCNTAIAFDRVLEGDDTVYDFGTTGNLRFSDLVMWDRQTESWWQQITGEAIVGELTGARLTPLPAQILGWGTFREQFPDADVLSRETGFSRAYGRNPYAGYDDVESSPFLFDQPADGRLRPMERIIGIDTLGEQLAIMVGDIDQPSLVEDVIGGVPIVVLMRPGSTSATDESDIAASRDVGQAGVFERSSDGSVLTFAVEGDEFLDRETGSTWSVTGQATSGPLTGTRLPAVPHVVAFWFAWAAAFPETRLVVTP